MRLFFYMRNSKGCIEIMNWVPWWPAGHRLTTPDLKAFVSFFLTGMRKTGKRVIRFCPTLCSGSPALAYRGVERRTYDRSPLDNVGGRRSSAGESQPNHQLIGSLQRRRCDHHYWLAPSITKRSIDQGRNWPLCHPITHYILIVIDIYST